VSESDFIDNYIKSLVYGWLIFDPPKEMTVNIGKQINATITKKNISESGETIEPIKVGPYMEVSLKSFPESNPAFDIDPITSERQFITSNDSTTWEWMVVPKKEGNQTLELLVYIIIKMPDGREEKKALTKSKVVLVYVNSIEKQGRFDFVPAFFESPWAKVYAALCGFLTFIALFFKEDILTLIRSKRAPPKSKRRKLKPD
jgi:hypothetical protein